MKSLLSRAPASTNWAMRKRLKPPQITIRAVKTARDRLVVGAGGII